MNESMGECEMHDGLRDFRRMPAGFGPTPGPRNLPTQAEHLRYAGEGTTLSLTARVDRDALAALLPDALELPEHAVLNVSLVQLRKIGWLAGRGYNILALAIPALLRSNGETGNFLPVMWESHADPIITGREELGYPKLYADIPEPRWMGDTCAGQALWDGFSFFDCALTDIVGDPEPIRHRAARTFTYKYMPRTFAEGGHDAAYLTSSNGPGEDHALKTGRHPAVTVRDSATAKGTFAFRRARWEDMPTQYHIVNRLADLPIESFLPARVIRRIGQDDASAQHRVD